VRRPEIQRSSSKASQTLQFQPSRHRVGRLLSCGSPGLRRLKGDRRAVWVWLSLFAVAPVFRCSALRFSARPAGQTIRRRPVRASLSSGATAEYDRSRQSLDSSVRSLARSILSDPPAQGFGPLSAPGSPTLGKPRAGVRPEGRSTGAAPSASDGGDLRRGCHTADRRRRSRLDPEGSSRTTPSECPRPKPGNIATEPPRVNNGKPSSTHERARGGVLVESNTQELRPVVRFVRSEPPTLLSEESQSSHHLPRRM